MVGYDTSGLTVTIIYEEVRSSAEIVKVSSGGIFLKTGLLLELGAQVELEFAFDETVITTINAQVTRIEPQTGTDEEIGLGLRYLNMSAKTWLEIERYLRTSAVEPADPAQFGGIGSVSQRFRVINQETDLRIRHVLAEIRDLQNELEARVSELASLLEGGNAER